MVDFVEAPASRLPVGFERGRQRYVRAFSLGYFALWQLGGPLLHLAAAGRSPYWTDPVALLAHAMGIVALGLMVLAPAQRNMAAYVVIWAAWATVWVAVFVTAAGPHASHVPFYLATGPLLAGLLLSARPVIIVGGLNVFGLALMGSANMLAAGTALSAGLLTVAATLVMGISAHTRRMDEAIIGGQARQLAARATELEAIMAGASDGMIALDDAGRIVNTNPAAGALIGATTLRRGDPMAAALPATLVETVDGLVRRGEAEGEVELNGRLVHIGLRPLPWPRDGRLVTLRDVTQERAAEEQRRLAEHRRSEIEKLQEVTRFKSNLLNAASHELNTPLTPVRLQMELLRSPERGPLTEKQRHSLDILDRNVQRLSSLVSDILDVAKLDNSRLPLRCSSVALERLVRDEVEALQGIALRRGLTLHMRSEGRACVWGDAGRLGQVLSNLVMNAIKFTTKGGIQVGFRVDGAWAAVSVTDTGMGVPEGSEARLFEPFSQLHETAKEADGAGMGLYLCKGIIEAHGGEMGYEREDQGSRFWFRLPVHSVAGPAPGRVLTH